MLRVSTLFALALSISAGTFAHASANVPARSLSKDVGVFTRYNSQVAWRPLPAGSPIPEIVEVKCDKQCVIQCDPDNTVELESGTVVSFKDHFFIPLVNDPPMTRARQIDLVEGQVAATSAPNEGAQPVVIRHKGVYVAVRGGRVQVAVKGGKVAASVSGADGRVASRRSWSTLEAGHSVILDPNLRERRPVLGVSAPVASSDEPGCPPSVAFAEKGTSTVGACWKPVLGAISYVTELSREPGFETILEVAESKAPSFSTEKGIGRFYARLRAVDGNGLRGEPSAPRPIAILPVRLPPSALVDLRHNAIVVPEGSRIEFVDASGLELALDQGDFLPLPGALKMDAAPSHLMRFRFKGDKEAAGSFTLERRMLKASILLKPRIAKWPQDPIDIAVRIEDPAGRWNPESVRPNLEVLVDMEPVRVDWSHTGATWTARLSPRSVLAPTVVRVIAKDEFGQQLGRGHVEVDYNKLAGGKI
jgi:hypothetical protein